LRFDLQTRIPISVWLWRMIKVLGTFVTMAAGATLLTANIDSPNGNETVRIIGGAILLSLGLIHLFSGLKDWMQSRQVTKQW
jgi:hypothetical protein